MIGPDAFCDFGSVVQDGQFSLKTYVVPKVFWGFVSANEEMLVEVIAVADNGMSKPIWIKVKWDGGWSEEKEDMSHHLVIKEIKLQSEKELKEGRRGS